jgi:hypothetical protein
VSTDYGKEIVSLQKSTCGWVTEKVKNISKIPVEIRTSSGCIMMKEIVGTFLSKVF